jgi:para-aminobenzoate synthetase/4-amino-4-deoxychorismate lyase
VEGKIVLEAYHFERLAKGIVFYGMKAKPDNIFEALNNAIDKHYSDAAALKLRLELYPTSKGVNLQIDVQPFVRDANQSVILGFASHLKIDSSLANHLKTTERAIYNSALKQAVAAGCDDMLLCNERGEVVEAAIYNLLWKDAADGKWYTPPLNSGCVAGVQRQHLLDSGIVQERICRPIDLLQSPTLMLCNALRGVVPVKELRY